MPVNQINKWLWVSGVPSPGDLAGLAAQGVKCDLNTTPQADSGLPAGMKQITLGWLDDAKPKPVKDFRKALKAIGKKPSAKAGVLCHCQGGVNRGPMLATVVLACVKGWRAKRAWQKVLKGKPGATAWQVPAYRKSIKKAVRQLGKRKKKGKRARPASAVAAMGPTGQ